MICTDEFVFIHYPKTGGTFVASVLETLLTRSGRPIHKGERHSTCGSIPKGHRGKTILACARNPYDLRVSQYLYGWWRGREARSDTRTIRRIYRSFRWMSFATFLDAWDLHLRMMIEEGRRNPYVKTVGQYSVSFIQFFARHPDLVLGKLSDAYLAGDKLAEDLFDVTFLDTEHLNRELCSFLLGVGYREDEIAFIRAAGKIQPPGARRAEHQKWENFYTPGLKALVRHRERMLFRLFPHFDV